MSKCPMEKKIPIYLLVGGGVGMVKVVTLIFKQRAIRQEDREGTTGEDGSVVPVEDFRGTPDEGYTSTSTKARFLSHIALA